MNYAHYRQEAAALVDRQFVSNQSQLDRDDKGMHIDTMENHQNTEGKKSCTLGRGQTKDNIK